MRQIHYRSKHLLPQAGFELPTSGTAAQCRFYSNMTDLFAKTRISNCLLRLVFVARYAYL